MYYRAKGKAVCADVIPYYEDGKFYLFYLHDYRDIYNCGEGCPWYLLTTTDFVNYEEHGQVLVRGTREEQDLYVFTGSCSKFNGEYYIFYTGHNPHKRVQGYPEEKIMLAKSKDLLHWEKIEDFVFEAPDWIEMHDFRDPYVYFDEEKQKYAMLLAGRAKNDNPIHSKGVTLVAYSDDLLHWEVSKEMFYEANAFFTHECPDLFKMGDWWYLIVSEFSDKNVTTYRMSKSLNGPWITPKVNNFDGHAFYAAKSASDGKRRFLFGWNCIRDHEQDLDWWQWGGTIIPHELVQAEDGTLYVKCPDTIAAQYNKEVSVENGYEMGTVKVLEDGYEVGDNSSKSIKMLGKLPENCKIEMTFEATDDIGDFGILLRAGTGVNNYYAVKFDIKHNRFAFDRWPRRDLALPIHADTERYCPIQPGIKNKVLIIVEGTVAEVYVNDLYAMSVRMFDFKEGDIGLYTLFAKVKFTDIKVSVR